MKNSYGSPFGMKITLQIECPFSDLRQKIQSEILIIITTLTLMDDTLVFFSRLPLVFDFLFFIYHFTANVSHNSPPSHYGSIQ